MSFNQLTLHKKIKSFLYKSTQEVESNFLRQKLLVNQDARKYFYSEADERWLEWLWQNDFLYVIKTSAKNTDQISRTIPELAYLVRMADKAPNTVVEIILKTPIGEDNYNPEVIDRFIRILTQVPAEHAAKLTQKFRDDGWVYLNRKFGQSGYQFIKLVEKLFEAKEYEALIKLADGLLTIKDGEDIDQVYSDSPFYVGDITAAGIFNKLAELPEQYDEKLIKILSEKLTEVIKTGKKDTEGYLDYLDNHSILDMDLFDTEFDSDTYGRTNSDLKNFYTLLTKIISRFYQNLCDGNDNELEKLFEETIAEIPLSRSTWRLKLFVLSQCPEVFIKKLSVMWNAIFVANNTYDIEGGTEYHRSIQIGFPQLDKRSQEKYVNSIIEFYTKEIKENPDKNWLARNALQILSATIKNIEDEDWRNEIIKRGQDAFGQKPKKDYEPKPDIGKVTGGTVNPKTPFDPATYSVSDLAQLLASPEMQPDILKEKYKFDDFLAPRGAEGLADSLQKNVTERPGKYITNLEKFFDRKNIHPHYLTHILRGIDEQIKAGVPLDSSSVNNIFNLYKAIVASGENEPFKHFDNDDWLNDWISVHKTLADMLLNLLVNESFKALQEKESELKDTLYKIFDYLLSVEISPAKDREYTGSDPYHVAINSVRGRAYEAFVQSVQNSTQSLTAEDKELFDKALQDNSRAIRFLIGRYMASFYYRDKDFIRSRYDQIFPIYDEDKTIQYQASWEGYLVAILYKEIYDELEEYYLYAISLDPEKYDERKYFKELDELLGTNLGLAYTYFDLEIGDELFDTFWDKSVPARHKAFIDLIGRSAVNGDESKHEEVNHTKLLKFWDWTIENKDSFDSSVFQAYGMWINPKAEVLDDQEVIKRLVKTTHITKGLINWDHGMTQRLKIFAAKDPAETLNLIRELLIPRAESGDPNAFWMYREEYRDALKEIYNSTEDKESVISLVDELIEKGSEPYWILKQAIE